MSRIGRKVIYFDSNIKMNYLENNLSILYQNTKKNFYIPEYISIEITQDSLILTLINIKYKNFYGLLRTLINNYIFSLTNDFQKEISVEGVGYKFIINKNVLILHMGYSHPISFNIPSEITIENSSLTKLLLKSKNNILLGDFCQKIKNIRPIEPYKGKGIKINNESIKLKVGKRGK